MRLIDADELTKDRVENDPVRIAAECAPTAFDNGNTYMLPRVTSAALNQMIEVMVTKTRIVIDPGSNANFSDCYVTLRYTKSTG